MSFSIRGLILILILSNTPVVFGQEPVELPPNAGQENPFPPIPDGEKIPASCFDYYSSGNVQVNLEMTADVATPEGTVTFAGEVTNNNTYPILNGTVLVKIFRQSGETNTTSDNDALIDQFSVVDKLKIPVNGSVPVEYSWTVPQNTAAGEYYASYYVLDEHRYNLAGLNFTDGVVGGKSLFTVSSDQTVTSPVTLVKSATTFNGEPYSFVGRSPHLEVGVPVVITTEITNPSDESKTVPLQWNQYAWDQTREENLRFTKTEVITLSAKETKTISYEVQPQSEAVVYVTVMTQDNQAKSLLNIRHARTGVEEVRLTFSGLSEFPLNKDSEHSFIACVQSTNETVVSNNVVKITLKDKGGTVLREYTYEGDFTGAPTAVTDVFSLPTNLNYAVLTTTLENKGVVIDEVTQVYDCEAIDANSCLPETESVSANLLKQIFPYLLIGIIIIGLIVFFMLRRKNHIDASNTAGMKMLLLTFMFGTFLLGGASVVSAANVTWNGQTLVHPWTTNYLQTSVTYSGTIQNVTSGQSVTNGANVAVGDRLLIQASPFNNNQIVWYPRQGGGSYAPLAEMEPRYGSFVPGAPSPAVGCVPEIAGYLFTTSGAICIGHAFYGSGGPGDGGGSCSGGSAVTRYMYIPMTVNPPAVSYTRSGTAGMTCNASNTDCTVTSAGTISFQINFAATYGKNTQYRDDWFCFQYYGDSAFADGPAQQFNIPAQSINFALTAVPNNAAPATPSISGPNTGTVNIPYNFNVSGTDPDGNNVRYGIADASCTNVSQWLPGAGHVASGASQTYNRSWASTGAQTIYVLSEDNNGARSSCAQHTITVNPVPPPTADLKANGSDGPINVVRNQSITLSWNGTNALACSKWGGSWGVGQVVSISGSESTVVTASGNYVINCGGVTDTVVVNVVNQNPNAPSITHPSGSAPYNTNTTFTITGTDPDGDNVFYEIDWNNDGIFDATSATVPSGSGVSAVRSWTATGPQTFQARTVDTAGARSGWTSHVITIQLPPAATALIEAQINGGGWTTSDQTVNPGDSVTMRWNSSNATTCTGTGAGFATGNNISGTDGVTTPAPNTASTFSVNCTGPGGASSDSIIITSRQLPNFTTPLITYNPLAFNTTTATYDSMEIIFQTSNNGGSDTGVSANYQMQFDRGSNGYDVTTNGSLGLLAVSASVNRTETVTNVPLGNNRIRVTVDSTNAVSEVNESDNVATLDIVIPPPNPGINITADRTQVRSGETVTLTWTAALVYPMNCRVFGPGVNVNPSGLNGTQLTQPITAKSEFTLSCTEPVTGTVFTDSVVVEAQGKIEEI